VADRRHQRTAIAGAVARPPSVHVPGMQAVGAVVTMPPAGGSWPHQQFTVSAAEGLLAFKRPLGACVMSIGSGQGVTLLTLPSRSWRDGW
jgi:hypothetical protein